MLKQTFPSSLWVMLAASCPVEPQRQGCFLRTSEPGARERRVASYTAEDQRGWNCSWSLQEPGIETRKRRKKIHAGRDSQELASRGPLRLILFCGKDARKRSARKTTSP